MTLSRRIAERGRGRLVPEWMGVCRETLLRVCSGIALQDVRTKNFSLLFWKGFFFFLMTKTSGSENVAGWNKAFCFVLFSLHSFMHFLHSFLCRASVLSLRTQRCCWCGNNMELHTVLLQIDHFGCIFHKAQPRRQVFYHCVLETDDPNLNLHAHQWCVCLISRQQILTETFQKVEIAFL